MVYGCTSIGYDVGCHSTCATPYSQQRIPSYRQNLKRTDIVATMQVSSQKECAISQDNAYYSVLTSLSLAYILQQKLSTIHYKH
jgi:hypothetical protein